MLLIHDIIKPVQPASWPRLLASAIICIILLFIAYDHDDPRPSPRLSVYRKSRRTPLFWTMIVNRCNSRVCPAILANFYIKYYNIINTTRHVIKIHMLYIPMRGWWYCFSTETVDIIILSRFIFNLSTRAVDSPGYLRPIICIHHLLYTSYFWCVLHYTIYSI